MCRELAARLAHDVGKYVARIARNVPPEGPFPAALAPLLAKDLYALPGGERASEAFARLAPDEPRMAPVRAALAEIDALEAAVRAGEPEACRRAGARPRGVVAPVRADPAETK